MIFSVIFSVIFSARILFDKFSVKFSFEPTRAQLKVFSSICSDLVVVWLIAILATKNTAVLIRDIVLVYYSGI